MENEYNNMTDAALQSQATQMDSILATGYAAYGLTAPQAAALTAATTGFGTGLANVASKRAALAGAVQGKDAWHDGHLIMASILHLRQEQKSSRFTMI